MTDRELLELAAKAAGMQVWFPRIADGHGGVLTPCHYTKGSETAEWNPLTDDGDALRLAVKLRIDIYTDRGSAEATWINEDISETHTVREYADAERDGITIKEASVRRAIVRAAAEIGRSMK